MENIEKLAEDLRPEMENINLYLYKNPEIAYQEYKSCQAHMTWLKKHSFKVEEKFMGIDTAFKAEYQIGQGGRTVCFLSEYDALKGLGHGCGHNLLGTTTTGSAILLSKIIGEKPGRILVIGTPGEEASGAKIDMAEEGAFKDCDAVFCTHPSDGWKKSASSLALEALTFNFKGKSAHSASFPEEGINALDAVIQTFNGASLLRQQTRESARISGIITKGGEACNMVPDDCQCQFYIREDRIKNLKVLREKMIKIAQGAALQTGCLMNYQYFEKPYKDLVTNESLSHRFNLIMEGKGIEMVPEDRPIGSLDIGNVSYEVPVINPYFDITGGKPTPLHTEEFRDYTLTKYAMESAIKMMEGLSETAYDFLLDDDFSKEVREEFEKNFD